MRDQPDTTCDGHAQKSTSKAEDVRNVTITKDATVDAVFDGHSGKIAVERCKNEPVPTLLEVAHQDSSDSDSDSVVDASTVDAFLDMDKRVGSDDSDDGTTVSDATKLLQCVTAWTGDVCWSARVPGSTAAANQSRSCRATRMRCTGWSSSGERGRGGDGASMEQRGG